MKHTSERGFTLVEIMIVVAIIALLAAIAIPNVLRGRATANETAAIGNVRALISSVEMYRAVYQAYPTPTASWVTQMYSATPPFGPPAFNLAMSDANAVQGFLYLYEPVGSTQYRIRARPQSLGQTGTRAMFGNESGQVFHCSGTQTAATITMPTTTIDAVPQTPCP